MGTRVCHNPPVSPQTLARRHGVDGGPAADTTPRQIAHPSHTMSPRQMGSLRRAVSLFFTILSACWGGVAAQLQGCYKANRNDFSTSGGMTVNYDVATYTGTQITNILDVNLASGLHCRCTCHAGLSYGTNTYTITSPSYCETPAQGCVCTSPMVGTTLTYSTGTDAQIGKYLRVTTSSGQTATLASRGADYPGNCPGDSGSSSSSTLVAIIATVSILGAAGAGAAFYYCFVYKSGEKMAIASSATSGVV